MAKQVQPELEQERDGIGEGVAETQQPNDPIAESEPTRQPEKQKVNLDEFAEFREWKAKTDKRLEQERLERVRTEQRYQQQLEEARRVARERQLAEMDDYQRTQFERDEAKQEAEYWRQQAALVQQQTERQRGLAELINEYHDLHGVTIPVTVFDDVTTPAEAYRVANRYVRETKQEQARRQAEESEERQQQREQRKQANKVDLGAGIGSTPKSDFERAYEKARASGDSVALARLLIPD